MNFQNVRLTFLFPFFTSFCGECGHALPHSFRLEALKGAGPGQNEVAVLVKQWNCEGDAQAMRNLLTTYNSHVQSIHLFACTASLSPYASRYNTHIPY
ncbi:hypothetical protein PoB_003332000 [Plakobranchus ocellatus]|uniref:Secreted protein n=1 Tax=Plakobranchus ocellatus TaxID=259542 RepID=A0AAV4AHJ4_9GAST|nr:hypothetical protein PoB_003332000 [Plakobranchus ocellatus]